MHAFLITGTIQANVDNEINNLINLYKISNVIPFELKKIEDSKTLKKITKFSLSKKTAYVMRDFDQATNEATNSILKVLEEPNRDTYFILTSKSIDGVLPTIISRCGVIKTISNNQFLSKNNSVITFIEANTSKKFEVISKIKERDEAVNFVCNLIKTDYENLNFKNMESYLKVLKNLKLNGNVSLQLANLVARMNLAYGK